MFIVMDEQAILSRYISGERAALEPLILRYEPLVQSAAMRQVGDSHLAQDITQATMMTLMRKAGRIGRKPLGPWLLKVTHNLAVDALRDASTRRRHERFAALQRREARESSLWRSIEPVLDEALHTLREKDRTILTLHYLQGWPFERIAAELGLTYATTRQRTCRALRRLRKLLARRGVRRDDLIPLILPMRRWKLFPLKIAAAVVLFATITGGFVLAHSAPHRQIPAIQSPPRIHARPTPTIP